MYKLDAPAHCKIYLWLCSFHRDMHSEPCSFHRHSEPCGSKLVLCPDPSPKRKEGLVFWPTFLVTWGGVEWHKECNYCIPPCIGCSMYDDSMQVYDCSASVQQHHSLDPASASNERVVEYLATVSPELELANGSLCCARHALQNSRRLWPIYLATAENITNELREKFAFGL